MGGLGLMERGWMRGVGKLVGGMGDLLISTTHPSRY